MIKHYKINKIFIIQNIILIQEDFWINKKQAFKNKLKY